MLIANVPEAEDDGVHPGPLAGRRRIPRAWYAVRTRQKSESRVLMHLTRKSVHAFLPLIEVVRRYRGQRVALLEPLFPGYVFVEVERFLIDTGEFNTVRWTPGVHSILSMGDTPVPVPDEAIEAMQARVRDLGFIRPRQCFSPRARVRIKSGPLEGLEAVFDRFVSRSRRVRVLMMLLGSLRVVEVDASDLESA